MLVAVIAACEVGFWAFLVAGLVARYPLRRTMLGAVLLVCAPLVDLILLATSTIHLQQGATADSTHGLAAAYLGFSVAFGHSMIRWADRRFAHRFAGGPPPVKLPREPSWARARAAWREWGKALLACAVASGLLLSGIVLVNDPDRDSALWAWMAQLGAIAGIWLLAGPLYEVARVLFGGGRGTVKPHVGAGDRR